MFVGPVLNCEDFQTKAAWHVARTSRCAKPGRAFIVASSCAEIRHAAMVAIVVTTTQTPPSTSSVAT